MAWEVRRSGNYYYRKVWRNGTCTSEYVGQGVLANLSSSIDGREQQQRLMKQLEYARFKQEQQRLDQAVNAYHEAVQQLVTTILRQAGFHQHKGTWRLKRRGEDSSMADADLVQQGRQIVEEYNRLHQAASVKKPKAEDVERLRQFAIAHPGIFDVCPLLANATLDELIASLHTNEATKIYMRGEVRAVERNLGYNTASYMERLLIKDVAICWLRMQLIEQTYTNNLNTDDGVTFTKAEYLEKRLSATRRRYLQSIEGLARVRGLLARAGVQINIAQQQVVMNN